MIELAERLVPPPNVLWIGTHDRIAFRECRRKWHFSTTMEGGLGKESGEWQPDLWFGTLVHKALAEYYIPGWERGTPPAETFEREALYWFNDIRYPSPFVEAEIDEIMEARFRELLLLGRLMLERYAEWAPTVDDFEVLAPEQVFAVPVRDPNGLPILIANEPFDGHGRPVWYRGRWDGIVRDRDGLLWLLEHKTAKVKRDDLATWLDFDDQSGSYLWGAKWCGYEGMVGVKRNMLYKRVPMAPSVVYLGRANEGPSRAKDVLENSTYELYKEVIGQGGYDPAKYELELDYLRNQGESRYFERIDVERTRAEIDEIGRRIYYEALDMFDKHLVVYPNPSAIKCPRCPFRTPCLQMSRGQDWQGTLAELYVDRDVSAAYELTEMPI